MDKIVKRLRDLVNDDDTEMLAWQAADRIEQLEAALRYYAKEYENPFGGDDSLIARAALGEKKDG